METVNLPELVEEIIPIVQPSISKKITVSTEFEAQLPAIEADRSQMQQILSNLVLNAAEAIGEAAGTIRVRTEFRRVDRPEPAQAGEVGPGNYVCLRVEDTGCGMDEETRRRIFDPFYTTKFTGRGLGLAAVAGIVRGHKGAIRVASTPGQGTSFTVFLPATARVAAAPVEAEPAEDLRGSGTILVVDDEAVVRAMAERALVRYGYEVRLASSGLEAIEVVRAGGVTGVLLDLSMPGMSGLETLAELRKVDGRVPVVLSSGYNEMETMRLFAGMDVAGFVQKPYTGWVLARKMKGAMGL
jgi:CheY-like chemotaxis protein